MRHVAILLGVTLLLLSTAHAQSTEADALFQAKDWAGAERAYLALVEQDSTNGLAWYRLGHARHAQERFEEAAQAWERSAGAGFTPIMGYYNVGAAYARLARNDDAFDALDRAAKAGFRQVEHLDTDPDLEPLRDDARFAALRSAVDRNARPCHYDERYRQFDFWIGEWNVAGSQGQPLGANTIELMLEECVLQENWTGGLGGAGKSLNYFDPAAGKWKQVWVNSSGGHTEYAGRFSDGAMRFEATAAAPDGSTQLLRMTFTPLEDGRVRQLIEQSTDNGATWSVGFYGYYVRTASTNQ